jgi:hypothetical protein
MMKEAKSFLPLTVLIFVLTIPAYHAAAQASGSATGNLTSSTFDTTGFPQWAKDLRRWEIVAFGSFPFAMFASTFAMDTRRWIDANGMDFTEDGRRYAPWPLKSAGAVGMTNQEQETAILIAAGVSVAIAFADLIIVQIKRHKERRRVENLPSGNIIIDKSPWPEGSTNDGGSNADTGDGSDGNGTGSGEIPADAGTPAVP